MLNRLIHLVLVASLLAAHPWAASAQTSVRFAVIGDYGLAGEPTAAVAALVKSWNPDLIITTGDNNYYYGAASTIDVNIGQYYAEFIHPYHGQYGPGGTVNRFFPSLGNHDWEAPGAQPYLDYFTLPGNERYYDFVWGPVHFFALDSDPAEPDGRRADSVQGTWLRDRLAASTAPWKIVYLHHSPLSSAHHGSSEAMQWPFELWGASAVISGHDHVYERITVSDFPYFVNGLGGAARYEMAELVAGSQVRFQSDHGAMRVDASAEQIAFEFITRQGVVVDRYTLYASPDSYPPDAPGNLGATALSGREIELVWADNSSNEQGFRVEQWTGSAWAPVTALGANATAHRVGALAPLTSYTFRLAATGAAGDSAPSAPAAAQTLAAGPPAAPSGLTAQAGSSGQISLAWVDNAVNETGFTLEQSLDGVSFTSSAAPARNARTHLVTGLAPDTTYRFRIRAVNGDGPSTYSNTASARTVAAADLIVTEMFNPPAFATAGSAFAVRDGVRNQGAGPAGESTTRHYLSLDAVRDASDLLMGGGRHVDPLTTGQTNQGTVAGVVPGSVAPGLYYLLACADDLAQVTETSRTNNCRASTTRVQIDPPGPPVTLTVTLSGGGSVTGPGIACGPDCAESFPSGASVTLTASAGPNSRFTGWTGGGCGATSPCTIRLTASTEIHAAFAAATPGDLVVTALGNPPAAAAAGASFTVSDTVANAGGTSAGASTTRYYLSTVATRTSAALLLSGSRPVSLLAPSGTSAGTASVTIPTAVGPGLYYLLSCADDLAQVAESNETNNCLAAAGRLQLAAPPPPPASTADLVVSELYNPPSSAAPGSSFAARDGVHNQGPGAAGPSLTRYYLSFDAVRDSSDILLGGSRSVVALTQGQTSKGTVNISVPAATPSGLYYLLACADDANQVGEASEGNNCRASQTRVQVGATAAPVTLTVALGGGGTGSVTGPGIACSPDCAESYPPGTAVTLSAAAGANSVFAGWVGGGCGSTSPCTAVLTASAQITATFGATATTPGDLIIAALQDPPASVISGASFMASDTVANAGPAPVGASTTRYFLSTLTTWTSAAVPLSGTRSVAALPPSGTSAGTTSVAIPSSLGPGPYYLLACADALAQVPESNEANNCRASASPLQLSAPPPPPASAADLVVTEILNPPASAAPGSSFGARDWVLNQGTASAGASVTRYYLSLDALRDFSDIPLGGSRPVGPLAKGQASKGSITVSVPASTPPGLYYLVACTDDANQVGEASEANNCRASQTRVTVGVP